MTHSLGRLIAVPLVGLALVAGACGSDKDSSSGSSDTTTATTAPAATSQGATPVTVKTSDVAKGQAFLDDVGCWAGPIDNTMGPDTEAAIKEFQQARGLTVDGQLGPATLSALESAADEGKRVCDAPVGSTTTSTAPSSECNEVDNGEITKVLTTGVTDPKEKITVGRWYCAPDSSGKAWVGGWYNTSLEGTPNEPAVTANFIMSWSGSGLERYQLDATNCSNPPIPQSLLTWCEAS